MHEIHAEVLARLINDVCPAQCSGAEVGVMRGATSAYLLRTLPGLQILWLIDRWDAEPFHLQRNRFSKMARYGNKWHAGNELAARRAVAFAADRVRWAKGDFRDAAALIADASLDFVFLDAAHSFDDTLAQIELYAPKVKPGGMVSGHDYDYPSPGYEAVAQAVDQYTVQHGIDLRLEPDGYVFWWVQE